MDDGPNPGGSTRAHCETETLRALYVTTLAPISVIQCVQRRSSKPNDCFRRVDTRRRVTATGGFPDGGLCGVRWWKSVVLCPSWLMQKLTEAMSLNFRDHGAERYRGAVAQDLDDLRAALDRLHQERAGVRIRGIEQLRPFFAASGSIGSIATGVLGAACRPVRAILFDKTPETNWSLAWHQDRTICVRQRVNVDGFGPWTVKGGMPHVAPPFDLSAAWSRSGFTSMMFPSRTLRS